jgi:hypothetical protein
VRNNPIRYNDPTGHKEDCDNKDCDEPTLTPEEELKIKIKYRFNWDVKGNFDLKDLQTVYKTGQDIQSYADRLTNGKGNAWMLKYLGNTTIAPKSQAGLPYQLFAPGKHVTLPAGRIYPNSIYLINGKFDVRTLAHEFGHIWDLNTGRSGPLGVTGGVADSLNTLIGGKVASSWHPRFLNPDDSSYVDPYIPSNVVMNNELIRFNPAVNGGYGNGSTADYLAESFAYNVVNSSKAPVFGSNAVDQMIVAQAASLP